MSGSVWLLLSEIRLFAFVGLEAYARFGKRYEGDEGGADAMDSSDQVLAVSLWSKPSEPTSDRGVDGGLIGKGLEPRSIR